MRRIAPWAGGLLVALFPTIAMAGATTVTLYWTATGDDARVGRATSYILVRSLFPISEANFGLATVIPGVPAPKAPGSAESFTITNLFPNTGYFFAIKAVDEAGNRSPISNQVHIFTGDVTGVEEPTSPSTSFALPWPNPARHSARCAFVLAHAGPIRVEVFDAAGRHVRGLADKTQGAGRGEVEWDLRDDAGVRVGAGTYFVRADLEGLRWTRRLVVIR